MSLLFTARYPTGLRDLLIGVARWNLRVLAYLTLLPGDYPPLRLDQGEREPDDDPSAPTRPDDPATPGEMFRRSLRHAAPRPVPSPPSWPG